MILIFLVGLQTGALAAAFFFIRSARSEMAANIGPRLKRMEAQLDSLEAALNLALLTRYSELGDRLPPQPLPPARRPAA